MPYASLRDFMARLEQSGRLVRVTAPVSPHLEMTEIQTRLLAEKGPAVLFENVVRADGTRSDIPVLVNLFGTVERVAWGMDREPSQLREVGETLAFLRQPEPPGGWREALDMLPMLRTVMAMKPKTVGSAPCQEIVLDGQRHRSRQAADTDLLAGRARAAHHLAADRHARAQPEGRQAGQLQSRHLSPAGDGAEHDPDALAEASRRRAASPALEGRGQARAAARGRRDRRRSGHDPGGRHAGARHALRIPVRRPAARQEGRAGRLQDRAAEGAGRGRDRARGPCQPRRLRRRGSLRRPHRLLQLRREVPGVHLERHHHAAPPDLSLDLHRPAARRAVGAGRGAERGVHSRSSSSSSRRSSISGCRPRAAATASPWCR